jgi:glyoxylase-like metal-dependent hydrolase (beta-lactamase superfamily II)
VEVQHFFDKDTFTLSYVIYDLKTRDAVVIDPVYDYDPAGGVISAAAPKQILLFLTKHQLKVRMVLETHAHADHLSSARKLSEISANAPLAIGRGIIEVQKIFKEVFALDDFTADGHQFDHLLDDGKEYHAGSLSFKVIATPGHTPACCCYLFDEHLFVGDLIFMPDYGTGRCDFPGGSAELMYDSIQKLYQLPDTTKVYVGHDYQPGGRPLAFMTSIGVQKKSNIHIKAHTTRDEFVSFRTARDKTLSAPKLLYPAVQFNIAAGQLSPANEQGQYFFKIPIRVVGD